MIHQPFSLKRKPFPSYNLVLSMMILFVVACALLFSISTTTTSVFAKAKEIVATKEWQLVGENDTVDSGMHIRMDLSTGQKWVKIPDDSDEDDKKKGDKKEGAAASSTAATSSTKASAAAVAVTADGEQLPDNNGNNNPNKQQQQQQQEYDYDMIHRTLSKLPDEVKETMELPDSVPDRSAVSPEQRAIFEAKLKQIWEARQQELMKYQEDGTIADLPQILRDRIERLSDYIKDPLTELFDIDTNDYLYYEDDDMTQSSAHIIWVLQDLEFQLNDMDMTRDFVTLGGWSLLVSLLADNGHPDSGMLASMKANTTTASTTKAAADASKQQQQQQQQELMLSSRIHSVQSHAAWALGTAVKNTQEFASYVVDPVVLSGRTTRKTTALDVLLEQIQSLDIQQIFSSKSSDDKKADNKKAGSIIIIMNDERPQKYLYALGSFLRGNRPAQRHFVKAGGPQTLSQLLESAIQQQGLSSSTCTSADQQQQQQTCSNSEGSKQQEAAARKLIKRLLTLADDIVTDVRLHESVDGDGNDDNPELLDDETIIKAFSSSEWCNAPLSILQQGDEAASSDLYETVLKTIQALMPYCIKDQKTTTKDLRDSIKLVKAKWQKEKEVEEAKDDNDDEDGIDPEYHNERMELVDNVLLQIIGWSVSNEKAASL